MYELPADSSDPGFEGDWADYVDRAVPDGDATGEPTRRTHPWRRYLARSVDYGLAGVGIGVLAAFSPYGDWVALALLGPPLVLLGTLPAALFLAATGTTPGKWLFGVQIRDSGGNRPRFATSLRRELLVAWRGLGLGIPVVSLFTMVFSYSRLRSEGETPWDRRTDLTVRHLGWSPGRGFAAVVLVAVFAGLIVLGSMPEVFTPFLDAELDPLSKSIENEVEKSGGTMIDSRSLRGSLEGGAQRVFPIELDRESVSILSTCDADCMDMDLTLIGPLRDTVALDHLPDAYPYIHYAVRNPGTHELVVDMYACEPEPCAFVARVLRYQPGSAGTEGTCFAVSSDGRVATAAHVIAGARRITVGFEDGTRVPARLLSLVDSADVAILATNVERSSWLTFSDPDATRVGQHVFTLGYPATDILGRQVKFTDGTVSSLRGPDADPKLIQTSVPIQPGNSGGPLLDDGGRVVGMVVSTAESASFYGATGSLPQNVNWAVPGLFVDMELAPRPRVPRGAGSDEEVLARALESVCYVDVE